MNSRIGEEVKNKKGYRMKIIDYKSSRDVDILFLDNGYIKKKCRYSHFKDGNIIMDKSRVGEVNKNKYGSEYKIIEYINSENITIQFTESKFKIKTRYSIFKNGQIRCPYDKTVYGIGFEGEGKYKIKVNGKLSDSYKRWNHMIERCYCERVHKIFPRYKDCTVCEEWHNYQNFATWYEENYYEIDGKQMQLDKDILIKGNKLYSPETCVFVTEEINKLYTKCNKNRGKLPIGVHLKNNKYVASTNNITIGTYDTIEEAFEKYKQFKENKIINLANLYKQYIPNKLYIAMINCKVEIDD